MFTFILEHVLQVISISKLSCFSVIFRKFVFQLSTLWLSIFSSHVFVITCKIMPPSSVSPYTCHDRIYIKFEIGPRRGYKHATTWHIAGISCCITTTITSLWVLTALSAIIFGLFTLMWWSTLKQNINILPFIRLLQPLSVKLALL